MPVLTILAVFCPWPKTDPGFLRAGTLALRALYSVLWTWPQTNGSGQAGNHSTLAGVETSAGWLQRGWRRRVRRCESGS